MTGQRYVRRADALWRSLPDGVLVLAPDAPATERPIAVLGPAAEVWSMVEAPAELDDLVEVLAAEHAAPPDEVRRDIVDVLDALIERRVVTVVEAAG